MRIGIPTGRIHIQRIRILIYLVAGANLYIVIQNDVTMTSSWRHHCDHKLEIFQSFTASSISRDHILSSEFYAIFMTQGYAISQNKCHQIGIEYHKNAIKMAWWIFYFIHSYSTSFTVEEIQKILWVISMSHFQWLKNVYFWLIPNLILFEYNQGLIIVPTSQYINKVWSKIKKSVLFQLEHSSWVLFTLLKSVHFGWRLSTMVDCPLSPDYPVWFRGIVRQSLFTLELNFA